MPRTYDNWERLVAAVLKKQELWELFHAQSRSPSIRSEASDFSSSFRSISLVGDVAVDFESSSTYLHHKVVFISDFRPALNFEDPFLGSAEFPGRGTLKASNSGDPFGGYAELLGRGTFGSAYRVEKYKGIRFVVKRLKPLSMSEPEFRWHMNNIAKIRHDNVVPLRAYYSSEDERLMLYDYYSKGSVCAMLHGQNGANPTEVDWETRLRIAIGAARGIDEIHKQNDGNLVHGNIKSSNIFLNEQKYGCVSDLGIAKMIATGFLPTARCYAPEVGNTQDVSQESDIYSFGVLLLELVTGKSAIHIPGGAEVVDLVKFVDSVKRKWRTTSVFDPYLLKHQTIREEVLKLLQIGIRCVAKPSKSRPKISEIVKMLEDLSIMRIGSNASLRKNLVFFGDDSPRYDLEDFLRASAEVLGKGTFGTSYKARLETGDTFVVKRMKNVNVTSEEFQQHIEGIGKMRHTNVAKLWAYYFSKDEVLLVYDYNNQNSLSALLHGPGQMPLDWETRLRIAVGAARGMAHIHRQDGLKLVHGNVKSSNIFLNEQQYGLITDVGLAKIVRRVRLAEMPTPGYCAPEVANSKEVSQASDVYSFGVVLLELIFRKPSGSTMDDGESIPLVGWVQSVLRNEWNFELLDSELWGSIHEEKILQLLQVAMGCVAFVPEDRPRMTQVVKMMEEISGTPSIESRFEDLLVNLLPMMTL